MLSYQHAYHAGNIADCHKHMLLLSILRALQAAHGTPLTYMETHAGRGLYHINSPEALKTGEAQHGIHRLFSSKKPLNWAADYLAQVRKAGVQMYPGSPLLAANVLRQNDSIALHELHPREHLALSRVFAKDARVSIEQIDGYTGVLHLAKGQSKRHGVVLIDPSYEVKTEYADVAAFVPKLQALWPLVTIVVWYPLLPAGNHVPLKEALLKLPNQQLGHWHDELIFADRATTRGMHGTALHVLNAPAGWAESVADLTLAMQVFWRVTNTTKPAT
ncbi:MAG: 23S rRNA (adenine(2030)-N(6))-methyltransferase RlmJ [Alphaproteobacteria bacterium]